MSGFNSRRKHKNAWDWLQNLLIVLLVCSAVYLTGRSGVFHELSGGTPRGWLAGVVSFFQNRTQPVITPAPVSDRPAMAAQPVRLAISNGKDRFAVQYDDLQAAKVFDAVSGLLGEALASAGEPEAVGEKIWQAALERPGVYFDFLGRIPLSALYAWLGEGGSNPNLEDTARRLLLAGGREDQVQLYFPGADGAYYACRTTVQFHDRMDSLLREFGGNGAGFAFEYGGDHLYRHLESYVLILPQTPEPVRYRAANPLGELLDEQLSALQKDLDFRPQNSSALYPVPGGVTIREGREMLNISSDGTVIYHAPEPGVSRYPARKPDTVGSPAQTIEAARKLASAAEKRAGAARLSLMGLENREGGQQLVRFSYCLNGSEVRLPGGVPAAEFVVQDGQITDYTIRFRSYEATDLHTLLMHEGQAAAAMEAMGADGRELIICYEDGGAEATAGWKAEA